jgi:putative redox protein
MAMDVVHILNKSRLPLRGLRAHLVARRAPEEPRRILAVDLAFELDGDIPAANVERAIALSREKYCSVWASLNPDIDFKTSFVLRA